MINVKGAFFVGWMLGAYQDCVLFCGKYECQLRLHV